MRRKIKQILSVSLIGIQTTLGFWLGYFFGPIALVFAPSGFITAYFICRIWNMKE